MAEACSAEQPNLTAGRRAQVLIADCDRELVELIAHTLQRAGLRSAAAHDERSAVELFGSLRPLVVVLDSTGLDLLERFRSVSRDTAIIVLTANSSEDARICAFEAGADHYLSKPFSHRELLARIRACLRRNHPGQRVAATSLAHESSRVSFSTSDQWTGAMHTLAVATALRQEREC